VFGGHIVAVAELSKRHDALRLVWFQMAGTAVATSVLAAVIEPTRIVWSAPLVGALLFTGVIATALALVWQMRAQRHMSTARAALLLCFEPVFATITSWVWFGERLSVTQWTGAALIVAGMILAELPQIAGRDGTSVGKR
jgi:drug/metabolite transporter (DMT)-like permease